MENYSNINFISGLFGSETDRTECFILLVISISSLHLCFTLVCFPLSLFCFKSILLFHSKNELINWLYYFTRQKDIIQRYYQSPDALILVSTSSTFNYFERMMTQLEKLTSLTFHLTYHPPNHDEQFNTSFIPMSTRDWMMTLSRRTSKTFPQPDTFRSTLSRKLNSFFMKNQPEQGPTFPRPLLNVDKPKSVRYRARTLPSK